MMIPSANPSELLDELLAAGVSLRVDGCRRLRMRAEPGVLTDELIERVKAVKPLLVDLVRLSRCERCGSTEFADVPIHDGNSLRRDCAVCGRTASFPKWQPQAD